MDLSTADQSYWRCSDTIPPLKPESRRSYYNCTAEMESRGESSGENESEEGEKSEPQASEYYAQQLFQKDIVDKLKSLVGTV